MPVAGQQQVPPPGGREPRSGAGRAPDPAIDPVIDVTAPVIDPVRAPLTAADAVGPGRVSVPRRETFEVHLDVFEGPFDLLLGLISKHKLDVTEIALSQVTDEFVAFIRAHDQDWDLGQASEFLLVAATLLDLKAARLLPRAEVEDDEDLALLEARDLLFARLLQYRAFKDVAATLAERIAAEGKRVARAAGVEPQFARLLPELVLGITPEQLAMIAAKAMRPRPEPLVGLEHLHSPAVSVRDQAALIVDRLRRVRSASFRSLISDAESTVVVVARFLALLELFRDGVVAFDQAVPLGDLTVRWTGSDDGEVTTESDFDEASAGPAGEPEPVDVSEAPVGTGEDGGHDPRDTGD